MEQNLVWRKGVCTGIFYGFVRPMKAHLLKSGEAVCGYKPTICWDEEVHVLRDDEKCKRCLKHEKKIQTKTKRKRSDI